jgi:dTDP-4-dehydrorhamnose 3,5-epimerase
VKVLRTDLPEVLLFEPVAHDDDRGRLFEAWHAARYAPHGLPAGFAQDVVVRSHPGVLRGLHLQHPGGQGKLIQALEGEVFDVAVDVRTGSPTFGRWVGAALSGENRLQAWIPEGFAHGYCVVGAVPALLTYKCSAPYRPEHELYVRWDDPDLAVRWPVRAPRLSPKDAAAPRLAEIPRARLPVFGAGGR